MKGEGCEGVTGRWLPRLSPNRRTRTRAPGCGKCGGEQSYSPFLSLRLFVIPSAARNPYPTPAPPRRPLRHEIHRGLPRRNQLRLVAVGSDAGGSGESCGTSCSEQGAEICRIRNRNISEIRGAACSNFLLSWNYPSDRDNREQEPGNRGR